MNCKVAFYAYIKNYENETVKYKREKYIFINLGIYTYKLGKGDGREGRLDELLKYYVMGGGMSIYEHLGISKNYEKGHGREGRLVCSLGG